VDGAPRSYAYRDLSFVERGGPEFIARLWAQRKIGYLLAQIRLHGVKDELVTEIVALSSRYGIVTPYTSFLVQEPGLALTQAGRDQLGRALQGLPSPGGVGGGRAGAPTAAPAAVEPLMSGDRSGEVAVAKAAAVQELAASEQAAAPQSAEVIRQVGDRTFLLTDGVWVDTAFDRTAISAETVTFGGQRYFGLLVAHPEIGRYLALGDRVMVVVDGKAYAIAPDARETGSEAIPSPESSAAATPAVSQPEPGAGTSAAAPTVTLCPGAAAIGLLGVMAPLYLRRRH
jgi:Ca-activated chloride channel family protein